MPLSKPNHFPQEIINDILSRLPLKSLVRFESVSMEWLNLLTNSNFPRWLIDHHRKYCTTCKGCEHCQVSLIAVSQSIQPSFGRPKKQLFLISGSVNQEEGSLEAVEIVLPDPFRGKAFAIKTNACDGMICVAIEDDTLLLWNPSIKDFKILALSLEAKAAVCNGVRGLGHDLSTDDYKVVSVVNKQVYAFSVKTNLWIRVGKEDFHYTLFSKGVSANGCLYFAATKTSKFPDLILCLDLSINKFREVPLPHDNPPVPFSFSLLMMRGSVCLQYENDNNTLWVLKEENRNIFDQVHVTWTNMNCPFEIQMLTTGFLYPKWYNKDDELVFYVEDIRSALRHPQNMPFRKRLIHGFESMFNKETAYTGSLVAPSKLR